MTNISEQSGVVPQVALYTIPGASAADRSPAVQALDRPPTRFIARQAVTDKQYAAEQEAAKTAPEPMGAVAVPVPGVGAATAPSRAATVILNFLGLNRQTAANNGFVFIPPDTILGKSPNQAIEATNSAIRLFASTGGVLSTADLNTFFGASTANGRLFDPKMKADCLMFGIKEGD